MKNLKPMLAGLYIHIPFSSYLTPFHDAYSLSQKKGDPYVNNHKPWLDKTLSLINSLTKEFTHVRWSTVFMGGGDPLVLRPSEWDLLVHAILPHLSPQAEWTVECDPTLLDDWHIMNFSKWGINRLSLRIFSFQESVWQNADSSYLQNILRAKTLLKSWKLNVNLDLTCALQGQNEFTQMADIQTALDWNPQHISWYSFISDTSSIPQDKADLWWLDGRTKLTNAGFNAYEIAHFAKVGHESRHAINNWQLEPYFGIGPSAVSFYSDPLGNIVRKTLPSDERAFEQGHNTEVQILNAATLEQDSLMMGLRLQNGISRTLWHKRWQDSWEDRLPLVINRWQAQLVQGGFGNILALIEDSRLFLDSFLWEAFQELDKKPAPVIKEWF